MSRHPDRTIDLGIHDERVAEGDHIAYFWETERQFEEAIGFLDVGLRGNDHCVVFGYPQANERVLHSLATRGFDTERLRNHARLSVVPGALVAQEMLDALADLFQRVLAGGAPRIRLLGNIGWGRQGWPSEADILSFEAKVTGAAKQFPCIVVCMYDVQALPGRIVLHGAFETHPITMCGNVLRENTHHVPVDEFLSRPDVRAGEGAG